MRAGTLFNRIDVYARTTTRGNDGSTQQNWTLEATRWADVKPVSGREVFQGAAVRPDVTHVITMRFYDGLTPQHQIRWGSRTFGIVSALSTDEAGIETIVLAIEQV